jgi:hypothetical protein
VALEAPIGLAGSSGLSEIAPPESCAAPATLLGFCAPTTTSTRRSTQPGLPTPVRSAYRVSHPLDGLLPPCLPISRTGAARGVHPPERFPPAEPYAFGAFALLLFLASRSLALRTRRSRCPAAPRLCSLRRSVPGCGPWRTKVHAGRCSHGLFCLSGAFPRCREIGFPIASLMRFHRSTSEEVKRAALQGLDEHRSSSSREGRPTPLRFSPGTALGLSRRQ